LHYHVRTYQKRERDWKTQRKIIKREKSSGGPWAW